MLTLLAFIVTVTATVISFAKEIAQLVKSIYNIKGAKIVLPVVFSTIILLKRDQACLWLLFEIKIILLNFIFKILPLIPFNPDISSTFAQIITLLCLTWLPLIVIYVWCYYQKNIKLMYYSKFIIWVVWLVSINLLSSSI